MRTLLIAIVLVISCLAAEEPKKPAPPAREAYSEAQKISDPRKKIDALRKFVGEYPADNGVLLKRAEELADESYRKKFPGPIHVEPYKADASRSGRVVLAEIFTGSRLPTLGTKRVYDRVNPDIERELRLPAEAHLTIAAAIEEDTVKVYVTVDEIKSDSKWFAPPPPPSITRSTSQRSTRI
jgi:hypothetical protein